MGNEERKVIDEMIPVYESLPNGLTVDYSISPSGEYKVGHHKPPFFLVVFYILVVIWCGISWIPFYGY